MRSCVGVLVCVLVIIVVLLSSGVNSLNQREVLIEIYTKCGGDDINGGWIQTWNFTDINECELSGVTCTNGTNGDVIGLELPAYGLVCDFPEEICDLQALQILDLGTNSITGTVPYCLLELRHMSLLDLRRNNLHFAVEWACELPNLQYLDLSYTNITSELPNCFPQLPQLTSLYLRGNSIYGTIPSSLAYTSLQVLDLSWNELTGTISEALCEITTATELRLSENMFSGSIPACIGNMSELRNLLLFTNYLSGTMPKSIGNLVHLTQLDVSINKLSGELPVEFCNMKNIEILYLGVNQFSGVVDPCFGDSFTKLQYMDISNNRLYGNIPNSFSNLQALISIAFADNLFVGTVPSFATATDLEIFDISNNQFSGDFVDLGEGAKLRNLYLKANGFSGTIPEVVCGYSNLRIFNIEFNDFGGALPSCLGNLNQLEFLEITGNTFNGSLPADLGNLQNLGYFKCGSNSFSGSLPDNFGNLISLRWFDASSNPFNTNMLKLTYPLILLPKLMFLDLSNTSSHGEIAYQLIWVDDDDGGTAAFPSLLSADFANNQLTGTIPNYLNWWQRISMIDLSSNNLEGSIPYTLRLFANVKLDNNPYLYSTELPTFVEPVYDVMVRNVTGNFECPRMASIGYKIDITIDPYYYNYSLCNCVGNYFGINGTCYECLDNAHCPGGQLLVVNRGYYPSPTIDNPKEIIECVVNDGDFTACNPQNRAPYVCEEGYQGRKCAQCAAGYYSTSNFRCAKCTFYYGIGIVVIAIVLFVFSISVYNMKNPNGYGTFRILILYGQTVAALISAEFPWPAIFYRFREGSNLANVGVNGFFGFECVFPNPNSFTLKYFLSLISPLLLFGYVVLLFLTLAIYCIYKKRFLYLTKEFKWDFIRFVAFTSMLFYFPVSKTVLSGFNCETDPVTKIRYLASAPYVECNTFSEWANTILPASVVLTVFFVALIPTIFLYFLIRKRMELYKNPIVIRTVGFLYFSFHKRYYYYGYVLTGRSLLLSILIGSLPTYSVARRLIILLVLLCFLMAQIQFRPFLHPIDNLLEAVALFCVIIVYGGGLAFSGLPTASDGLGTAIFILVINALFLLGIVIILCLRFKKIATAVWVAFKTDVSDDNVFQKFTTAVSTTQAWAAGKHLTERKSDQQLGSRYNTNNTSQTNMNAKNTPLRSSIMRNFSNTQQQIRKSLRNSLNYIQATFATDYEGEPHDNERVEKEPSFSLNIPNQNPNVTIVARSSPEDESSVQQRSHTATTQNTDLHTDQESDHPQNGNSSDVSEENFDDLYE